MRKRIAKYSTMIAWRDSRLARVRTYFGDCRRGRLNSRKNSDAEKCAKKEALRYRGASQLTTIAFLHARNFFSIKFLRYDNDNNARAIVT